jgi:hypothetical protein
MKAVLLAILLAIPASVRADVLNPPGGPVYVDDDQSADFDRVSRDDADRPAGAHQRQRDPNAQRIKRSALRAALMQQFDVNGDGKLGPRERQRAIRVLQRLEQRLAGGGRGANGPRAARAGRMRRFVERYDTNGDGNVGPNEVPRGAAKRLRRFDRDGNGWVTPDELGAGRRGPGPGPRPGAGPRGPAPDAADSDDAP